MTCSVKIPDMGGGLTCASDLCHFSIFDLLQQIFRYVNIEPMIRSARAHELQMGSSTNGANVKVKGSRWRADSVKPVARLLKYGVRQRVVSRLTHIIVHARAASSIDVSSRHIGILVCHGKRIAAKL